MTDDHTPFDPHPWTAAVPAALRLSGAAGTAAVQGAGTVLRVLALALSLAASGCLTGTRGVPTPTAAGLNPAGLVDPAADCGAADTATVDGLMRLAAQVRAEGRPAVLPPKRSVLVISGGGALGAYPAGVLTGWTEAGTRPEFDVVTGVSTGAIIAVFAFLGPDYDGELRRVYTTLKSDDIFRLKHSLRSLLLSEAVADDTPLGRQIAGAVTPEVMAKVAAAHACGRRLYAGTTDLDGHRAVVWDLGAIACRGTPEARDLFVRVVLASASIPGLFPPVRIPVDVNGCRYVERHVDGGVTSALFFRPPYIPPADRADPAKASLYDSDLYILVAGKLFPDAEVVSPRAPLIAATSISTLIYSQTRGELHRMYATAAVTGMNYRLGAIPQTFAAPSSSTTFDPVEMTKMFDEGERQARCGTVWRATPPGTGPGEETAVRTGTELNQTGPPPSPTGPGAVPPGPRLRRPLPVAR